ncbi:hypothetical protein K9L97_04930 [Candidatus Woesearchaeota archaeon]|nr:hypothetical protein [Candidatus Woesearchaeota archaeon]
MNVKQTVKKMSAVLTGAAFLGATVVGAMALNLNDYPMPLVEDGAFVGKIVVGSKGTNAAGLAQDILGAIDIAASLQAAAKEPVTVSGGTVTVAGGKVEDVLVGTAIEADFGTELDYTDLPFLADSSVDISIGDTNENYDYHEEIRLNKSASSFGLNVTTGLDYDGSDDYKDNVFLTAGKGTVGYYFEFDESLSAGNYIANATSSEPITLNFLGREMEITGATATSITVQVGEKLFLEYGETAEVDGHDVNLVRVSNTNAIVSVDGSQGEISDGQTKTIGALRVKLDTIYNDDGNEYDAATLIIGDEATKTYQHGEEYIGEDKYDPEWRWVLSGLAGPTPTLGVEFAADLDGDDGEEYENYESVIYEGQSIMFPGDFAEIKFDSLTQTDYAEYSFDIETRDLYYSNGTLLGSSVKTVRVRSDMSNSGLKVGTQKTDTVYVAPVLGQAGNFSVYYSDSSTARATLGTALVEDGETLFTLDFSKSSVDVNLTDVGATVANMTFNGQGIDVSFVWNAGATEMSYLGMNDQDTDTGLYYSDSSIAGHEEDLITSKGIRINDPDSEFQKTSGDLKVHVPADVTDFRANIVISGEGTQVTADSDTGAYTVNPFALGAGILDVDAGDLLGETPLLVVGGPYVNSIAAELMGNPTGDQIMQMFEAGKAKIKLYGDQNAVLVAGYSAMDTQGAAYVLADYSNYDFDGQSEVEVLVTSLESDGLEVVAPTLPSMVDDIEVADDTAAADDTDAGDDTQ